MIRLRRAMWCGDRERADQSFSYLSAAVIEPRYTRTEAGAPIPGPTGALAHPSQAVS